MYDFQEQCQIGVFVVIYFKTMYNKTISLDLVFVLSGIIKVSVSVSLRSRHLEAVGTKKKGAQEGDTRGETEGAPAWKAPANRFHPQANYLAAIT